VGYNRDVEKVRHETYMREAIAEAEAAHRHGDVPVGAVAVHNRNVIGRGHNRKEESADPTAHAEMIALRQAARALGGWRLAGVTLYCTMEPCPMCAGAMILARLPHLVYAVDDPKSGAAGSVLDVVHSPALNHQVQITKGVLASEARELLDSFFRELRQEPA
jgi:tRNA(adenine34) deaminase